MKKIFITATIVAAILVGIFSVFSYVKAKNEKKYYAKKEEILRLENEDPVLKVINNAYKEIIDVAKETDLPVKESFFEINETTVDVHVLTTYGSYEVFSVEKPSKEEVLKKVAKGALDLIKDFL